MSGQRTRGGFSAPQRTPGELAAALRELAAESQDPIPRSRRPGPSASPEPTEPIAAAETEPELLPEPDPERPAERAGAVAPFTKAPDETPPPVASEPEADEPAVLAPDGHASSRLIVGNLMPGLSSRPAGAEADRDEPADWGSEPDPFAAAEADVSWQRPPGAARERPSPLRLGLFLAAAALVVGIAVSALSGGSSRPKANSSATKPTAPASTTIAAPAQAKAVHKSRSRPGSITRRRHPRHARRGAHTKRARAAKRKTAAQRRRQAQRRRHPRHRTR